MKIIYFLLSLLIIAGCKKELTDPGENYAMASFQNASTELNTVLLKANNFQRAMILLDNPAVSLPDPNIHDKGIGLPYFDNSFTAHNNRNLYFYPNANYNNGNEPWITYMQIQSGHHQIGISDTSKVKLTYSAIDLDKGQHYSLFFTDSAGVYSMIGARDEQKLVQNKIRLRIAHMSPSNDLVFLSAGVDKKVLFQEGLRFKQVSAYQELPMDSLSRYTLRICKKNDPETVLCRTFIFAVPGRSYTVIFKGYTSAIQYKDRFGKDVSVESNPEIFIERTN